LFNKLIIARFKENKKLDKFSLIQSFTAKPSQLTAASLMNGRKSY